MSKTKGGKPKISKEPYSTRRRSGKLFGNAYESVSGGKRGSGGNWKVTRMNVKDDNTYSREKTTEGKSSYRTEDFKPVKHKTVTAKRRKR